MSDHRVAQKIFNSAAKGYDFFLNFTTLGFINWLQNKLIKNTPLKDNVLEIGTGTGELLKKISKLKKTTLIGVDISENMLKVAKKKTPEACFIRANAENLPVKENVIDNVFYSLTFRHLNSENQINQLSRIVKNGGTVSILDLGHSKLLVFLFKRLFKPVGKLIFSEEEYNYFLNSMEKAKNLEELENLFSKKNFKAIYKKKFLFSSVILVIFRKDS